MHETSALIAETPVPALACNTVILGAGAAGMAAAVHLVGAWRRAGVADGAERVAVVTAGIALGASRMSGSDKQTYYKLGTSARVPDAAEGYARTLTAAGCCHGDLALVEGLGSLRGFYHLVELGVPFPHDAYGAFVGYKTDHDPAQRATSAGPKTSRFMSECLQAEAERLGVRIIDRNVVVGLLVDGEGPGRRLLGMLTIDRGRVDDETLGLRLLVADNWILAAGGPGAIYRTTVYPPGQVGIHGAAFAAGLTGCNLTESQYGLASTKFRWNVSGTYMQAIPRVVSTDADGGDERDFLCEYFPDMPTMAGNIFLKGYQWPFDAQRIAAYQSSLIDLAVHQETVVRKRRVWLDFRRNPTGPDGWSAFDIAALSDEAGDYLRAARATQRRPIDRLDAMNPPAIEIYAEHGIDLHHEPLEIALCAQHHNGGFVVDKWWQSDVPGVFVVGEMAGTHGVKRPGGSALNAGQVGAARSAEYIARVRSAAEPDVDGRIERLARLAEPLISDLRRMRNARTGPTPDDVLTEIGERMTRCGAHLRSAGAAAEALRQAVTQYRRLAAEPIRAERPEDLPAAVQARQQCLTHVAMLNAIDHQLRRSAGSRGSHCVLDPAGQPAHPALIDPATGAPYRILPENESLRDEILQLTFDADAPGLFAAETVRPRPIPDREIAFEPAWAEYRQGRVFDT